MATIHRETIHNLDGTLTVRESIDDEKYIGTKKTHFNNGDFITLFQEALIKIAIEGDFSKGASKLLFLLIGKTEVFNEIKLPVSVLTKELGEKSTTNMYNYLKELEIFGVLLRDKKTKIMRLNYNLAYKGKIKEYPKVKYIDSKIGTKTNQQQQLELDNKARESHENLMVESHNELKILSKPIDKNEIKRLELLVKQGKETIDAFYGTQKQPKKRLSTLKQ